MARYIDADKLIDKIFPIGLIDDGKYTINAKAIKMAIDSSPTADVAPRAEVDELKRENESLAKTVNEASELIRKQRTKIEKVKAEVAKEIFEEIEDVLLNNHCLDEWSDYPTPHYYEELKDDLAELKKKYTGERHGTTR